MKPSTLQTCADRVFTESRRFAKGNPHESDKKFHSDIVELADRIILRKEAIQRLLKKEPSPGTPAVDNILRWIKLQWLALRLDKLERRRVYEAYKRDVSSYHELPRASTARPPAFSRRMLRRRLGREVSYLLDIEGNDERRCEVPNFLRRLVDTLGTYSLNDLVWLLKIRSADFADPIVQKELAILDGVIRAKSTSKLPFPANGRSATLSPDAPPPPQSQEQEVRRA